MKISSVQPDIIYPLELSCEYNLIVLIDWTTCDIQLVS